MGAGQPAEYARSVNTTHATRQRQPQSVADTAPAGKEIVVDGFAGGGGTAEGIREAMGKSVELAYNHSRHALAMHEANHPYTAHCKADIRQISPAEIARRNPIRLAWFSPDCRHYSKAKGGAPLRNREDLRNRDLPWVAVRWAREAQPRIVMVENVEEWEDWGPLAADGKPDPARKGETFSRWMHAFEGAGYKLEHEVLRGCDYGSPTVRKRMFVIARRDRSPIVWPSATHGPGLGAPHPSAAQCIDWEVPVRSIFLSSDEARRARCKRPLAEATLRRIARGTWKYVIESAEPFIIGVTHSGDDRVRSIGAPLATVTGAHRGEFALVAPTLEPMLRNDRATLTASFLMRHFGSSVGHSAHAPLGTVTAGGGGKSALISAHLCHLYGSNTCGGEGDPRAPARTVTTGGHAALVQALLMRYRPRGHGVGEHPTTVWVAGEPYQIADLGMRMLTPRELFRAQGFRDSYVIDPLVNGKPLTKTWQIRLCGNAVPPQFARALVEANVL